MLRIIDHKRIDLTESEYKLYQELVKAYTTPTQSGEEYFRDLFETDSKGVIIFLKPPTKNFSSMECFLFIVDVMIHQHLGAACSKVDALILEAKKVLLECKQAAEECRQIKNSG